MFWLPWTLWLEVQEHFKSQQFVQICGFPAMGIVCNHQQFVSDCGQCTTHGSSVRRSPLGLISPVKTLRVGRKLRLKMQKVDKARKEREARCESMNFYDLVWFQRCLNILKWIWHDLDWFDRISQNVAWSCTIQEFSRVHKAKQDLQLRTAAESKDLQVLAGTIQVRNGANHLADLLSFVQVFAGVLFVSMKEHCNMHQKSSEEGRLEGHLDAFYINDSSRSVRGYPPRGGPCACCLPVQAAAQKLGPAHTIVERGRQVPLAAKSCQKTRNHDSRITRGVNYCISAFVLCFKFRSFSNSDESCSDASWQPRLWSSEICQVSSEYKFRTEISNMFKRW